MGMSIEEKFKTLRDEYTHLAAKYLMMQADYENRLKADMVAILEELKEQLREMHEDFFEAERFDEAYGVSDSMDIILQKINALKAEIEPQESEDT